MPAVLAGFGVFACAETLVVWVAGCGFGAAWLVNSPQPTGGHISTEPRINDRIRVPEVRLVGPAGEQVGIVRIEDALRLAREAELDLVEVAPMARPPVAKLMDYGKFKYENAQKARESRRHQTNTVIKEMKLRPKIDSHDYETKKGHVVRFLKAGDKVKITIMFRGREQSRPELGYNLLKRLASDVDEYGYVSPRPSRTAATCLWSSVHSRRRPRPAPRPRLSGIVVPPNGWPTPRPSGPSRRIVGRRLPPSRRRSVADRPTTLIPTLT